MSATELFRKLPSAEKLLRSAAVQNLVERENLPHTLIIETVREVLADVRQQIKDNKISPATLEVETLAAQVVEKVSDRLEGKLRPVVNATGVVLHTNLGRAPLSAAASRAVAAVAENYNNLEYDLESGERGSRLSHVESLIARLSGAEAGIAVNNNAAAVFMVLSTFAQGKEVVLSRGQAVEIGGSFRIPDVMAQSGAKLVEVGTTNKTYGRDYAAAIRPETAMLMRVHSSNFKIIGFTESPELAELATIANSHNVLLVDDLGSGTFLDTARYGLAHEPTVPESIAAGADLVTFSGDKLLGGPQAGLIAGKKELIQRLKKHPLARALRLDKMTLAALQVTLLHYMREEAEQKIPVWYMLSRRVEDLQQQATAWQSRLANTWPQAAVIDGFSTIGGGSLPGETLPTKLLALPVPLGKNVSANSLTLALRKRQPPVVCRVERETLLFDPRTILPGQDEVLLTALQELSQTLSK